MCAEPVFENGSGLLQRVDTVFLAFFHFALIVEALRLLTSVKTLYRICSMMEANCSA